MRDHALNVFTKILERGLLVWLLLLCAIAYAWPSIADVESFDPFVTSRPHLKAIFAVTMLCIGALIPADEIAIVLKRWPTVLGGTCVQYAAMPLLAFALVRIFHIEGYWAVGVMMAGCVPGAMASNVLTLMARGNVSYSVSLTTSATLLSPLIVPFALQWTLQREVPDFPVMDTLVNLVKMVVAPVIAGHLLTRWLPIGRRVARTAAPLIANLAILWIIAVVIGLNREHLGDLPTTVIIALLALNLLGYGAGWLGGSAMRLDSPMCRALTLEVGMQNAGLGATLAASLFPDTEASLPAALYTFGCMLTGTILARLWAEFAAPSEEETASEEPASS